MYFFASIIDFLIVLLLLRFLIKPNEAFYHPIYSMIYRITDFMLTPSRYITRKPTQGILVTIIALVVIRGALYVSIKPMPFIAGVGTSLLGLFQFLFQAYMVIWFISILSRRAFGSPFIRLLEHAFIPFDSVIRRLGIPREQFYLFVFLFLWILYSFLSIAIRSIMIAQSGFSPLSVILGLAEGLMLILAIFPFPGFFSLVIIIGALLSWVSPDPSNPIVQAIYSISEPLLAPFRRFVPLLGGLDVSPIIALLCFHILGQIGQLLIVSLMKSLGLH